MKSISLARVFTLSLLSFTCSVGIASPSDVPTQDRKDTIGLRSSYDKCIDAAGAMTFKMLDCIDTEHAYQDKRLNKIYEKLMTSLSKNERVKLREDEKKWIAYRDSYCALDPDGGQGQRIDSDSCFLDETAKQATALEARHGQPAALTQYDGNTKGLRPSYIECIKATNRAEPKSQSCMEIEYKYQDARLNKAYKSLMTKSSESEQAKLRTDEGIWIAFRDSHCAVAQDIKQAKRVVPNDCLIEETAKQAFALEARLSFL